MVVADFVLGAGYVADVGRATQVDITGMDWRALLRGAILWAPNLMHNRPQKEQAIDPYLTDRLLPGVRFRFNLSDLTSGDQEVLEWPGGPVGLAAGVNASLAVPAAIRPPEFLGRQWADGLTVDGFPLRQVVLETGVDRVFVVGVAPWTASGDNCPNAYRMLLRAVEWNQYSEVLRGLARAAEANAIAGWWVSDRAAVEREAEAAAGSDKELRDRLLSEIEAVYRARGSRRSLELHTDSIPFPHHSASPTDTPDSRPLDPVRY